MDVEVAFKLKKAIARSFAPSVLVGDGMLIRLRSTTIGILGLVAAVGLGLVGFVSNQGWPGVFGGPLPQAPTRLVENQAISAPALPSGTKQSSHPHRAGAASSSPRTRGRALATAPSGAVTPAGPVGASAPPGRDGGQPQAPSNATPKPPVAQVPPEEGRPTEGSSAPESPGPTTSSPGHSGESHGKSAESHGRSGEAPGHTSGSRSHSGDASGRNSVEAPEHTSPSPGHSGNAPGHSGESHGRHG